MSFSSRYCFLNIKRCQILNYQLSFPKNTFAKKEGGSVSMIGGALKKKKLGKLGPMIEKKVLPVETDSQKLGKYACGTNIYKTGEDAVIKPDSEYPDWLWNLRLGPPPPLEELDMESKEYWRRVRKMAMRRNNQMAKLRQI